MEEIKIRKSDKHIHVLYKEGTINLIIRNERLGEIEKLHVSPSKRRKGLGSFLLRKVEALAKEKGLKKLSLLCSSDNDIAIRLYIKEGYEEEAKLKNHFREGLDSFVFSKFI